MKFKQGPQSETTLELVVEDIEIRFTQSGKRLARIYCLGFERLHIQMWDPHESGYCDKEPCRLRDLVDLVLPDGRPTGRTQTITATGKATQRDIHTFDREPITVKYFTISTWESHVATTPLPDNIGEVPY